MNQRNLIIIIAVLLIAAVGVSASGLNLQGFLQKKPTDATEIAPTDERRPTLRRRGTASDGGAVQFGQQEDDASGTITIPAPAPGQRTKGGPGSAYMDQWYEAHPEAFQDANGNAAQIGSGRPAEVPGLPSLAEIERRRQQ